MAKKAASKQKIRAFRRGWISEYLAAFYLMMKGYRILSLRYKTRVGEIDIIARKGDIVVFCEVKARPSVDDAIFAVNATTQKRIRDASDFWLSRQKNASRLSQRYDVIAIVPLALPKHIENCF